MKKLSIIIPVYNEAQFIKEVIQKVSQLKLSKEIICVDDCSTDGTLRKLREVRKKHQFRLVVHKKNRGKGTAVRNGLKRASGFYSIIYDADLEYPVKNIPFLLKEMEEIKAGWPEERDISIYGSRFLEEYRGKLSLHYFANRFLTSLTNLLFSANLTDMETCLKMCPTAILKSFNLSAREFEIEPELTAKLIKKNVLIIERPVEYIRRKYSQGKKIGFKDGLIAIKTIFKERFRAD